MASWLRWLRPARVTMPEPLTPLEARIIGAWRLTLAEWTSLTDHERADRRFNFTKAPGFRL